MWAAPWIGMLVYLIGRDPDYREQRRRNAEIRRKRRALERISR